MTWKDTGNKILNKLHTKKRWPYAVMFILWIFFLANASIVLMLGVIGAYNVENAWAPRGSECLLSVVSDGMMCSGEDCEITYDNGGALCRGKDCSFGNNVTLGIETSGDYNADKTLVVNADVYENDIDHTTYPAFCPPPEWIVSLIIQMFNFDALALAIGSFIVMLLIGIRIVVWARDWRTSRKGL